MSEIMEIFTLIGILAFGWGVGALAHFLIEVVKPSKKY